MWSWLQDESLETNLKNELIVMESKLTVLATRQDNKSLVEARDLTLFGKLEDQEDGKLMSQSYYLIGLWMLDSFIEQRERRWGNKVKRQLILQISPGMANLGERMY